VHSLSSSIYRHGYGLGWETIVVACQANSREDKVVHVGKVDVVFQIHFAPKNPAIVESNEAKKQAARTLSKPRQGDDTEAFVALMRVSAFSDGVDRTLNARSPNLARKIASPLTVRPFPGALGRWWLG
jgi:hypothetical protein